MLLEEIGIAAYVFTAKYLIVEANVLVVFYLENI